MESYKINPSDKSGRAIALPAPPPPRSLTLGLIEHSHVKTGVIRCQRQFSQLPIFLKQFPCLLEVRQIGISLAISMQKDFASLFWYVMLKERLTCSRCRPGQNSLAQWCSIHVFCYFWLQFSHPSLHNVDGTNSGYVCLTLFMGRRRSWTCNLKKA